MACHSARIICMAMRHGRRASMSCTDRTWLTKRRMPDALGRHLFECHDAIRQDGRLEAF